MILHTNTTLEFKRPSGRLYAHLSILDNGQRYQFVVYAPDGTIEQTERGDVTRLLTTLALLLPR